MVKKKRKQMKDGEEQYMLFFFKDIKRWGDAR